MNKQHKDSNGDIISAGDYITSNFGIPPVKVTAKVYNYKGTLCVRVLEKGVKPSVDTLENFINNLGNVYKEVAND